MSMRNKKLDMPYSQIDDVQEYVEAFDLETSDIDFNVIDEYKESPYALDASTLNSINDDINIMQNNWSEDIDETLDDKAELFQSWIDNLGKDVRPWNNVVIDKNPYLLRRSANGSLSYPFNKEIDKLVGGTVAWNQLVQNGNFADTSNWQAGGGRGTLSASSNELSYTITTISTTWGNQRIQQGISLVTGHKYLVSFGFYALRSGYFSAFLGGGTNVEGTKATASSGWNNYATVVSPNSGNIAVQGVFDSTGYSTNETVKWRNFICIDLTQAFGTEIADYVYSLEQTTAGSGIAWLKSYGFFAKNYYAYNEGSLLSVKTSAHVMRDENDVVIGNYPLDSNLELRGLFKLDANNNLYADGDVYESSGAATRKYGIVDLGTLEWTYNTTAGLDRFFSEILPDSKNPPSGSIVGAIIIAKYDIVAVSDIQPPKDKVAGILATGKICIRDTDYTDAATFKTAMSGVYLVYELKTPTTETAQPYANPQIVSPLGTEEYVDTRDVPIPVGHETKYLNNDSYYYKNDMVTYSGDVGAMFLCLQDCDGSQPLPTALTVANDYWLRVYDKGKPGLNVYNLTDKGKFNWQNNYVVNDVVWMDERHINFYVCINNVSYTINNTPNYDSAHWVKLFTVYRDGMPVYWEIPNQSFFNDMYSPSIFGVAQGTSLNFDSIDVLNNITNITEEDSSLQLSENEIMLLTIYKQDGNAYSNIPMLHCGTLINVPLIESGVIYKIPLNFLFYNMHMGLLCIYEEGVGVSFILAKLDNNDNVYYDIDGYIDESYFIYNRTQYESFFPNVPYIKIEFNKHVLNSPVLVRLIDRIHTQDISNPQYIKLKTISDAVVEENNIVLNTLNDLINELMDNNNI